MKAEFGVTYSDRITAFTGVATGRAEYISGCTQVLLAPTVDAASGAFRESQWFDEQRLIQSGDERIVLHNDETPGPDRPAPKR